MTTPTNTIAARNRGAEQEISLGGYAGGGARLQPLRWFEEDIGAPVLLSSLSYLSVVKVKRSPVS